MLIFGMIITTIVVVGITYILFEYVAPIFFDGPNAMITSKVWDEDSKTWKKKK
jgi:hypothetical protein